MLYAYVVAYDSAATMDAVAGWLPKIRDQWSKDVAFSPKLTVDAIIILGKGTLWRINAFKHIPGFDKIGRGTWAYVQEERGNLSRLFLHMLSWMSFLEVPPLVLGYATDTFGSGAIAVN